MVCPRPVVVRRRPPRKRPPSLAADFVFDNLKPGAYTLISDAVVTQYQLDEAETGDTILVEVKADEIVDSANCATHRCRFHFPIGFWSSA